MERRTIVNSPDNIGRLIEQAAEKWGGRTWLRFGDRSFSFEEAAAHGNGAARALKELGVGPGDVVASILPNAPEALFVWFGAMQLGALYLPLNPRLTAPEIVGTLRHAEPSLVVGERPDTPELVAALSGLPAPPRSVGARDVAAAPSSQPLYLPVAPNDPAVLIQTSGTTGSPKLVVQTHRAYVMTGEGFPFWLGLRSEDHLLTCLPLFHLNAQAYSTLGSLSTGAPLTLLERFSVSSFWPRVRAAGATQFNAIGAMLEMLMAAPPSDDDAQNRVRLVFSGPAPERTRHLEFERRFGLRLTSGYALSESPYGMIWPREGPPPYQSIGGLRQHPKLGAVNEARVVDENGVPVDAGAVGELLLRNPAVMQGYYRLPDETRTVLRSGWLHTGDLVRQDEAGTYYFVGRKKEVIRRRGENLSPREVELVLTDHPAVVECAVV
ncbi:MAG TPA: AMP-binding protein, partial [Acidimicrobiia bacterium]|nr:AMP-binding protein [Acidimicrobiia bacterium]